MRQVGKKNYGQFLIKENGDIDEVERKSKAGAACTATIAAC